jgi:glyceraldehyde 3-phosphate dehydrogenase
VVDLETIALVLLWLTNPAGSIHFNQSPCSWSRKVLCIGLRRRGRFDGIAVRGPVPVGSLADLFVLTARPTTVAEVNAIFTEEAATVRYRGIVGVTDEPIVSSDIIKDSRASVIDLGMTQVVDGDLVKVLSWYDNEWGIRAR